VNKAFSSFHGESLEITFTVLLIRHHINTEYIFQNVRKRENKFFMSKDILGTVNQKQKHL